MSWWSVDATGLDAAGLDAAGLDAEAPMDADVFAAAPMDDGLNAAAPMDDGLNAEVDACPTSTFFASSMSETMDVIVVVK